MKKTAYSKIPVAWLGLTFLLLLSNCANKNFFPASPLVSGENYTRSPPPGTVVVQAGKQYRHSGLYHFWLGSHYRHLWAEPVKVPVLDLEKEKGGLQVEEKGGSFQTMSFALTDTAGRNFVLRSVEKDPASSTSGLLSKTAGVNFLRDQTAALNPYAALVVAPLAEAAGIPQPNPRLVYVRKNDPALGEFKAEAGDRLYMLEEKYSDKKDLPSVYKDADDLASTKKMLRKIYEEDDHLPDQLAFAKARLFDIFINDRDRHQGQWEWAVYKQNGNTIYKPIAKDRDQALYHYDKGFTSLLLGRLLHMQKFQPFKPDYSNLHALTVKSEFIDQRLLNMVTQAQFDSLARDLQQSLTDAVIEEAVRAFPPEIYAHEGPRTTQYLKSRRDKLAEAAAGYYKILAKEVLVTGSDDEEVFKVKRLNNNQTEVTVHRKSDDSRVYHRLFQNAETAAVKLIGLGGDDEFEVSGKADKGLLVTIVGGVGEDEIKDTSNVKSGSKKTIVYDTRRGTELESGPETKNKTSRCVTVHAFDREGY